MSGEDNKVFGHDYDGIQEFDNPLPGWWLMTFYGTIVFAAVYFAYYELGSGPTLQQELDAQMAAYQRAQPTPAPEQSTDEQWIAMAKDPASHAKGQEVFKTRCVVCHGPEGQGLIGPNLTDNYWLHGDGQVPALLQVIRKGVPDKGMLAWETMLKPEEIASVAGFVTTLKGTNPANPKPPQGNLIQ